MPELQPVSSSFIKAAGYDLEESAMFIQFASGVTWKYENVPEATFDNLVNASSAGSYFHSAIKNSFDGAEV